MHRDIKPANLLIDQQSHVWVADFGLARLESDAGVTLSGDLIGTLRYMSPEQAAGKPALVDFRTDIHALGATLFELLVLRPPFDSDDRAELLRYVATEAPQLLRRIEPRIPIELETIVAKAMEKDPSDRYASAGEMASDLHNFLQDQPISARPPSLAERVRKWARRHAALVTIAFAALMVAAAGLTVGAWMLSAANQRTVGEKQLAEDNLRIAVDAIDRLLARVAEDADVHGQLRHAEALCADAADAYDRVLKNTNDPDFVLKAARARGQLATALSEAGHSDRAVGEAERGLMLLRTLPDDTGAAIQEMETRAYLLSVQGNSLLEQLDFTEYAVDAGNQPAIGTPLTLFTCPSTPRESLVARGIWVGRGKLDEESSAAVTDYSSTEGVIEGNVCVPGGWGEVVDKRVLEIRFAQITDGLSNTLLIVERAGLPDLYSDGGTTFTPHRPPRFRTWGNVGLWAVSAKLLMNHITTNYDHSLVNYDNFKGLYSFHAGGVQVALADGSVQLLSDAVENSALIALVTRDGGEDVDAGDLR